MNSFKKSVIKNNTKGFFFICCFRISNFFTHNAFLKIIGLPVRICYRLFIQWVLGIDIPDNTRIGRHFNLYHGFGVVINEKTIIGNNVTIRHCTTIGNSTPLSGCPVIEDFVDIGANVVIIGQIVVGENCTVGAGSVLTRSVPANSVVVGNPAKIIRIKE